MKWPWDSWLLLMLLLLLLLLLMLLLPDVRMVTDEVDTVMLAVDHVHRPVRRPGISEELHLTAIRSEKTVEEKNTTSYSPAPYRRWDLSRWAS